MKMDIDFGLSFLNKFKQSTNVHAQCITTFDISIYNTVKSFTTIQFINSAVIDKEH